ncbi:2-phosphosulfolactate phosphatase [Dermatobacter hominis]|uniref:2-phosphosulfolactate phosphatase n=1 Tax=Dermatobacter hominis TaxID=2884263 RepID=UPI001D114365|nr:2-phosphosulfolactate phosphatase [Dermatobacter hominis]UDY34487.1 2-phosphosulfolactate phosphatase [Dermatobacter hominis]
MPDAPAYIPTSEVADVGGAVVAIDVLRAFTTAACAFGAGASEIWLVGGVAEALALADRLGGAVVMGEEHGRRPDGFDLSNSPVAASQADLDGRVVVQRTSAGTQGVVAARAADRLFAASLVCASATARAVDAAGLGAPTYVLTGWLTDRVDRGGEDDRATAELIERARRGEPLGVDGTASYVAATPEAERTLAVGEGHVHPDDVALAVDVDRFDFAMEVERRPLGLCLVRSVPG